MYIIIIFHLIYWMKYQFIYIYINIYIFIYQTWNYKLYNVNNSNLTKLNVGNKKLLHYKYLDRFDWAGQVT